SEPTCFLCPVVLAHHPPCRRKRGRPLPMTRFAERHEEHLARSGGSHCPAVRSPILNLGARLRPRPDASYTTGAMARLAIWPSASSALSGRLAPAQPQFSTRCSRIARVERIKSPPD